jgi:hypothetical protein
MSGCESSEPLAEKPELGPVPAWVAWKLQRRARHLVFEHELLLHVLAGRARVVNLPADAYVDAANYDFCSQCFQARVLHGSFEPVMEGALPAILLAEVTFSMEASR